MTMPEQVLVADWSKDVIKRVTYRIDVAQSCVTRLTPPAGGWTINGLVDMASELGGSVLVLIDVAIGLPLSLFNAMRDLARTDIGHFLNLLRAQLPGEWLGDVRCHKNWDVRTPYIHVPKGVGSLFNFKDKAAKLGVCLHRAIDIETGGRSPLILSGIPGTVGSGSRDVIRGLGNLDAKKAAVWPFDGPLAVLLASGRVVLAEIYPRALYGHALLDAPSGERCLVSLGKTKGEIRNAAVVRLQRLQWHRVHNVELDGKLIQRACDDEDDFDAYLSALGILRLLLENVSLEDGSMRSRKCEQGRPLLDSIAEGGMLGVLATQLDLKQRAFVAPPTADTSDITDSEGAKRRAGRTRSHQSDPWVRVTQKSIDNAATHKNNRQISYSGLPSGAKNTPARVEIQYEGRPYALTINDTNACWRSHQISTAEDFDALYDLLSTNPNQCFPVELVQDRPPAGEDVS